MPAPEVLVVGAAGRLGLELIRAAAASPAKPPVHAFLRTPSKLPTAERELCASVIQGDALSQTDVERALTASGATYVVHTVGVPNSSAKTDLREKSAETLMDVIRPDGRFGDVRVVVVSAVGVGGTHLKVGFGLGRIIEWIIRDILRDHDNREKLIASRVGEDETQKQRILVVRATGLSSGKAKGGYKLFKNGYSPSGFIDRKDLAEWIIQELSAGGPSFGAPINITGK